MLNLPVRQAGLFQHLFFAIFVIMKKIIFSLFILAAVLIAACDYIAIPKEDYMPVVVPADTVIRKVLLEDYTGHTCASCPNAAAQALLLKQQYRENLIVIGLHTNVVADPVTNYPENFHTTAGDAYFTFFSFTGTPVGMVNRIGFPSLNHDLSFTNWPSAVGSIINSPPRADIEISHTYDTGTRQLNISTSTKFLNDTTGNFYVVALITEDSIYAPQLDNTTYVPNYLHRHVLRGSVPDAAVWGYQILNGGILAGDTANKTFPPFTLNGGWDDTHCYIVVYVYDNNPLSSTYKEILQAEEQKIR